MKRSTSRSVFFPLFFFVLTQAALGRCHVYVYSPVPTSQKKKILTVISASPGIREDTADNHPL